MKSSKCKLKYRVKYNVKKGLKVSSISTYKEKGQNFGKIIRWKWKLKFGHWKSLIPVGDDRPRMVMSLSISILGMNNMRVNFVH